MLEWLGLVSCDHVAQRTAARLPAHRPRPAMDLSFDHAPARLRIQIVRQRFEDARNQRAIVAVAARQRLGTREQPSQDAVRPGTVRGRIRIDATAAEGVEHEPGSRQSITPERPIEQDRDAQVVAGPIVVGHMGRHRASQPLAGPRNLRQPLVRQRDHQGVELVPGELPGTPGGKDVVVVTGDGYLHDGRVEYHVRPHQDGGQGAWQHFHAAFDRILGAVARHRLEEVAKADQPGGQVRLGGHVAVGCNFEIPPGDRVRHLVQDVCAGAGGPGMAIVVGPEPAVPARLRQHRDGLAAEILDRPFRVIAEMNADLALVTEKRPVHDDGAAGCREPLSVLVHRSAAAADRGRSCRRRSTPPRPPRTTPGRCRISGSESCRRAGCWLRTTSIGMRGRGPVPANEPSSVRSAHHPRSRHEAYPPLSLLRRKCDEPDISSDRRYDRLGCDVASRTPASVTKHRGWCARAC